MNQDDLIFMQKPETLPLLFFIGYFGESRDPTNFVRNRRKITPTDLQPQQPPKAGPSRTRGRPQRRPNTIRRVNNRPRPYGGSASVLQTIQDNERRRQEDEESRREHLNTLYNNSLDIQRQILNSTKCRLIAFRYRNQPYFRAIH